MCLTPPTCLWSATVLIRSLYLVAIARLRVTECELFVGSVASLRLRVIPQTAKCGARLFHILMCSGMRIVSYPLSMTTGEFFARIPGAYREEARLNLRLALKACNPPDSHKSQRM